MKTRIVTILSVVGLAVIIAIALFLAQNYFDIDLGYKLALGLAAFFGLLLLYHRIPQFFLILVPIGLAVGTLFEWPLLGHIYEVTFSEVWLVVLLALFLVDSIFRRDWHFDVTPTGWVFLALIGFMALSLLWADSILQGLIVLRVFAFHFVTFWLTVNILTRRQKVPTPERWFASRRGKVLLWALPLTTIAITAQLVWKLYDLRVFELFYIPTRESIITPVGKWVTISAITVVMIPIIYGLSFVFKNLLAKAIAWCTAIAASVFSLFTLGKAEAVALLGGLISFAKQNRQKRAAIIFTILIFAAIILIPLSSVSSQLFDRLANVFSAETTAFRLKEYTIGFDLIQHHWLLGVGAGNLKEKFIDFGLCDGCYTEANNYLLQIFTELGVVGLALFSLLIKTFVDLFRRLKKLNLRLEEKILVSAFVASAVVALINGFFEVTFWGLNYGIIWWYITGLIWGLYLCRRRATTVIKGPKPC